MTERSYTISETAYCKAVLHSAKYVNAVCGVLTGRAEGEKRVVIEDALPIAHSSLAVFTSPLTECALRLAKALCTQRGQAVVGVYFGNEIADDRSIGVVPTRLAESVRESFESACLLMIEAPNLAPQKRLNTHCFRVCVRDTGDSTWARGTLPSDALSVSEKLLAKCDARLRNNALVHSLVDFEDHCADLRLDWLNTHLFEKELSSARRGNSASS